MIKAVVTGDIAGFTKVGVKRREKLAADTKKIFETWFPEKGLAEFFRGDSFQLLFDDAGQALFKSIQLRCWFKKSQSSVQKPVLDARISIGIGDISYFGGSVLDADGEAFHLSGRTFDKMGGEYLRIVTTDDKLNKQFVVIADLMDVIISGWTVGQAEVIYHLLEGKTQQQTAAVLNITQSAVNNRLKLANWKEIERTINYISAAIT